MAANGFVGDERKVQKNYWIEHSIDQTVEAMMLDSKAADLDKEERPEMLKDAGFDVVVAEDRTNQFIQVLQRELNKFEDEKDTFISDFSQEDYDKIVEGWKAKLMRSSSGEQR